MTNQIRKVGVTGAAGFIGSHLCEALVFKGYRVIGVDNLSKGSVKNLDNLNRNKNFSFSKIDITNFKKITQTFKSVNVIVHLAAAKIPRYGDRIKTLLVNTKGTENVLETAKNRRAKVIFISTSDVYGKSPKLPFKEDDNLLLGSSEVARWAYAASKIFDEHLCFAYWEKHQVPFVILRLFGVYGPRQHRSWWGGPQSLFIDKIVSDQEVEIHGDGNQTRTFVYIDDVVGALIKSIDSDKAKNQVINIGTEEEISVINLAKLIAKLTKKPLKIKRIHYESFTGKRYEDVRRRVPEIKKARELLGWKPKVSLPEGFKRTIDWYVKNPL